MTIEEKLKHFLSSFSSTSPKSLLFNSSCFSPTARLISICLLDNSGFFSFLRFSSLGMRLAGVEGAVVHEKQELKEQIEQVLSDKEIGILLLTEKFGRDFPDVIDEVVCIHVVADQIHFHVCSHPSAFADIPIREVESAFLSTISPLPAKKI